MSCLPSFTQRGDEDARLPLRPMVMQAGQQSNSKLLVSPDQHPGAVDVTDLQRDDLGCLLLEWLRSRRRSTARERLKHPGGGVTEWSTAMRLLSRLRAVS